MADLDNLLMLYRPGAEVWCENAEQVWLPAVLTEIKGISSLLRSSSTQEACLITASRRDGETVTLQIKTASNLPPLQNPKVLSDVKDLTELSYLHEPAILENLRHRYVDNHDFYSYCGIILIAINPYSNIRQLYDNAAILSYRGQSLVNVDPHVYGIAEAALVDLERENRSQTVVVSGESGAGKTISAKYVMAYLAEVSRLEANTSALASAVVKEKAPGTQSTSTEARVLATDPIFEAFGNAKTVRNNNSSRFGKLIRTEFAVSSLTSGSTTHARISGAKINTYLLEKSRVVGQALGERSFHVFYQLCAAVERAKFTSQKQQVDHAAASAATAAATLRIQQQQAACDAELLSLGLDSAHNYEYLRQSGCYDNADMNDCKGFDALRDALGIVGLRNTEQWVIFRVVAAVLHLGNVSIGGDKDSSTMSSNDTSLVKACELLSIDAENLALACTRKRMLVSNEMMLKPIGVDAACASRDAMAKHMYACLFNWLVLKLRASLGSSNGNATISNDFDSDSAAQNLFIGILDIYGFETFQKNGFEQLCINFANEHLQQLYVKHVFKLEQAQYAAEKIEWTKIDFSDNTPTINLLEMQLGVFNLLDEECKVPNGNDKNWLTKMENRRTELCGTQIPHHGTIKSTTSYKGGTTSAAVDEKLQSEVSSFSRFQSGRGGNSFVITHFAGKVEYNVSQFVDKNRDEINVDIVGCLQSSRNALVAEIYDISDAVDENGQPMPNNNSLTRTEMPPPSAAGGTPARTRIAAPYGDLSSAVSPRRRTALQMLSASKKRPTVSFQFRQSLQDLMKVLDSTTPHFIRCIKPNDQKKPFLLDNKRAIEQLRACGVLETCRIASAGFPTRWPFERFVERYRPLAAVAVHKQKTMADKCQCILKAFKDATTKSGDTAANPDDKYRIGVTKIFLRAHVVAVLERMRQDKLAATADFWKRLLRGRRDRRRYLKLRESVLQLQAAARGFLARKLRDSLRRQQAAIVLQAQVRKHQARKRYVELRRVVIHLQAHVRGAAVRHYCANIKQNRAATKIQAAWRGHQARKLAKERLKKIVVVQACVRRFLARRRLRELKLEARNVTHLQSLSKGLENKLFKMQRHFDAREAEQRLEAERQAAEHRAEVERLRRENAAAAAWVAQQQQQIRSQVTGQTDALVARIAQLEAELKAEKDEKTKLHRKLRRADKVQENVVVLQAKLERIEKQHEKELNALRRQLDDAVQSRDDTLHHIDHMGRQVLAVYEQLDDAQVEIRTLTRQLLLDEQAARSVATANAGASSSSAAAAPTKSSGYTSWFSLFSSGSGKNRPELAKQMPDSEREKESETRRIDALLEETANLRSTVSHLRAQLRTAQMYGSTSTIETPLPSMHNGVDMDNYNDIDNDSTLPAGASATSARPVSGSKPQKLAVVADDVSSQYEEVPAYDDGDIILEDAADDNTFVVVQPGNGTAATTQRGRQSSFSGWSTPLAQWFSRDGTLSIPSALMNGFCERFTQIDPYMLVYGTTMKLNDADEKNNNAVKLLPAGVQAYIIAMALRYYDSEHDEKGLQQFVTSYTTALSRTALAYTNHKNEDSSRLLQVIDYYTSWYAAQLKLVSLMQQLNATVADDDEVAGLAERLQAQCFKNFDFSPQMQQFNVIGSTFYGKLCTFMQEALRPYIIGALIQYNSISTTLPVPDYTPKKADRRRELLEGGGGDSDTLRRGANGTLRGGQLDASQAFRLFREYLNIFYDTLTFTYRLPPAAVNNIFRQLIFFTSSTVLNTLLISTKYCAEASGFNMQLNLNALRDWLRTRPALTAEVFSHNAEFKMPTTERTETGGSGSRFVPSSASTVTPVQHRTESSVSTNSASTSVLYEHLRTPTDNTSTDTISVASSSVMTVREFAATHNAADRLEPLIQACTLILMRKSRSDLSDKLTDWSHLTIPQIERILMNCEVEQFSHGDEKSKVVEYVRQRLTEMEARGERRYVRPRFLLKADSSNNSNNARESGDSVDGLTLLIDTSKILVTPNNWITGDGGGAADEPVDLLALDLPSEYLHAISVRKL